MDKTLNLPLNMHKTIILMKYNLYYTKKKNEKSKLQKAKKFKLNEKSYNLTELYKIKPCNYSYNVFYLIKIIFFHHF